MLAGSSTSVLSRWPFGYGCRERQAEESSNYYDSYNCKNMRLCVEESDRQPARTRESGP